MFLAAIMALSVLAGTVGSAISGETRMLRDIRPDGDGFGQRDCDPLKFRGKALFTRKRQQGVPGQLWVSDGTRAGTRRLKYGGFGDRICSIAKLGSVAVIGSSGSKRPSNLWRTNLTRQGTKLLKTDSGGASRVGGFAYFDGHTPSGPSELWRTDGTRAGTTSLGREFHDVGGVRFADSIWNCRLLSLVKREPNAIDWTVVKKTDDGFRCGAIPAVVNGRLILRAEADVTGVEIWASDGTSNGTKLLRDINPGPDDSWPLRRSQRRDHFAVIGKRLLFTAWDPERGLELWRTDGTPAGTALVRDIKPGRGKFAFSSEIGEMTKLGDIVLFSADDGEHGQELWKSDGTRKGTKLVKDIMRRKPDAPYRFTSSYPGATGFERLRGYVYFSAQSRGRGYELWRSDGTRRGTRKVQPKVGPNRNSRPEHLTGLKGKLLFSAATRAHGREPWVHIP